MGAFFSALDFGFLGRYRSDSGKKHQEKQWDEFTHFG
jgi:hypothetical protein